MTSTVNVPTNTKVKEQDINNKLQLYGIYAAFANGKVPSNKQIDVALNSFLASRALSKPSNKLSREGHELIADVREVVELAKQLLLSKNEGNVLQDFIWHTEQLNGGSATTPNAPVDKDTAKQHGNEALEGFRTLGTLLISNGQFRKLLNDALTLARSMAGDAASNAAQKIQPSDQAMQQIDKPAEDNTWHDTPDLSTGNIKSQIQAKTGLSKKDVQDVKDAAQSGAQGHDDPQAGAQEGANKGLSAAQDKISKAIPEEKKQQAREKRDQYRAQTKEYFSKKMPQERREQTIWSLKKMIVEVQGHEDYSQAVDTLLRLAETYAGHGKNLAQQGTETVNAAHDDDHLQLAERDLKLLLERFANGTSADDLFESIKQVYRDADQDPELNQWFKDLDTYIRRCLKEQGYVLQDDSTDKGNELYDRGQFLLRERYRSHTDRVLDEFKFLGDQFAADPQSKKFGDAMNKLFNDLGHDNNGKVVFKKHLVKDLTDVILPAVFENIRYVPIPRIEYSDPQFDAIIENLVIEGDNLAPNMLELGSDNQFKWGRKQFSNNQHHSFLLSFSGIQCDLRDVSYYINKKQGFPSIKDTGLMDIYLGGDGFSFTLKLASADKADKQRFFKVDKVNVSFKHMNIKLKQSKFKIVFALFKPLLLLIMKPIITKVLEQQIRQSFDKLDELAYGVYNQAQQAKDEIQDDPENAPNVFNRYYKAGQQQLLKGKKKAQKKADQAQEKAKDVKVNVAVTKNDSIFKNIALPGGISTKATEYKDLAAKGDKWESPVFSIGSARESTTIPKTAEPKRKPHDVTEASLTDPKESDILQKSSNVNVGGAGAGAGAAGAGAAGLGAAGAGSAYGTGASTGASAGAPSYGTSAFAGAPNYGSTGAPTGAPTQQFMPVQQTQPSALTGASAGAPSVSSTNPAALAAQQAFSNAQGSTNGVTNGALQNGAGKFTTEHHENVIGQPPIRQ